MPKTIKVEFKLEIPEKKDRIPFYYSNRQAEDWIRGAIGSIESTVYPGLRLDPGSVKVHELEDKE